MMDKIDYIKIRLNAIEDEILQLRDVYDDEYRCELSEYDFKEAMSYFNDAYEKVNQVKKTI